MIRAMALLLALVVVGSVFWDPAAFLGNDGKIPTWQGVLLIWSVCSSVIYGVGFLPQHAVWRYLFYPPVAIVAMIIFLVYFYSK